MLVAVGDAPMYYKLVCCPHAIIFIGFYCFMTWNFAVVISILLLFKYILTRAPVAHM